MDRSGAEYDITFGEVFRVHAWRLDLMTATSLMLCFDYDYGESIEVSDGMEGFDECSCSCRSICHCRLIFGNALRPCAATKRL